MRHEFKTDKKRWILEIDVKTYGKEKIVVRVYNPNKPNTFYIDRWQTISGSGKFFIRLPQTADVCILDIFNKRVGNTNQANDPSFRVTKIDAREFPSKLLKMRTVNWQALRFLEFAQEFSENAAILSAKRSVYTSDNGKFRIDYVDYIRGKNGKKLATPARINAGTGVIEISKYDFLKYTVPMRMAILLHEYAHVYVNKQKSSEIEADLNALFIYMVVGYPTIEAKKAFLEVFKGAPTAQNKDRDKKITAFIDNFEKKLFKKYPHKGKKAA